MLHRRCRPPISRQAQGYCWLEGKPAMPLMSAKPPWCVLQRRLAAVERAGRPSSSGAPAISPRRKMTSMPTTWPEEVKERPLEHLAVKAWVKKSKGSSLFAGRRQDLLGRPSPACHHRPVRMAPGGVRDEARDPQSSSNAGVPCQAHRSWQKISRRFGAQPAVPR